MSATILRRLQATPPLQTSLCRPSSWCLWKLPVCIEKNIRKVVISFPLCGVYYDCRLHIQSCLISLSLPNSPKFILFFLLLLLILLPSKIVIKWIHKWKNTFLLQKNRKFKCSSLKKMAFDEKHWEIFERKKTHYCCWGGWAWVKKATELFVLRLITKKIYSKKISIEKWMNHQNSITCKINARLNREN